MTKHRETGRPPLAARLCGGLGLVLILLVVLLCLPLTVPRLLGYEAYAIVSGSMEPAIPTGSLAYAQTAQPEEIVPGDVIVFRTGGEVPITHRVVENRADEVLFITKGDANEDVDMQPVPYTALLGRVTFHLPLLGWVLPGFSNTQGKLALIGLLLAGVLFRIVADRLQPDEPDETDAKKQA